MIPPTLASLLISRLETVSTGWNTANSAMPDMPEPTMRARAESLDLFAGRTMFEICETNAGDAGEGGAGESLEFWQ